MYEGAARLDPDSYRRLARATFAEMALAGITAVGEFHYLHHGAGGVPYDDPNAMGEALICAASDAGIRITLIDACYLWGGLGRRPLSAAQARFGDATAERWAHRVDALAGSHTVRVAAAIHSVRAVDAASFDVAAGSLTALIGPNGAGKSSLFYIVSGFLRPERGTVRFEGRAIQRRAPHRIARAGLVRTF